MERELDVSKYPLDELKSVIKKHLLLRDDTIIDIIVGTVVANFMQTDPLWMLVIGPPSSGKTELLNMLSHLGFIYMLSDLTPSTLLSGKSKNGNDPSLIHKLSDKIVVMKDFTTILNKRPESQAEILAQLREVYDGYFSKAFGTGDFKKEWRGQVGFIGACTPVYDKHYGVIGSMGDRFILYRCHNSGEIDLGLAALKALGNEKPMRKEMQEAAEQYFSQFDDTYFYKVEATDERKKQFATLAHLCSLMRCTVSRDRYSREIEYFPEPEGPTRVVKQLFQLGGALAYCHGEREINSKIYSIITKIGCDLLNINRKKVIEYLYQKMTREQYDVWLTTGEIAKGVDLPAQTTLRILEDLMVLKVLNRDQLPSDQGQPYRWCIRRDITEKIVYTEMFNAEA